MKNRLTKQSRRNKKAIRGLGIMVFLLSVQAIGQDIHFTQFTMLPAYINPSQTGEFNGNFRAVAGYRSQWRSVTKFPYSTYGGIIDAPVKKNGQKGFWGLGLNVFADKAGEGDLKTTSADIFIAYHIRLSQNSFLSGGLTGGILQRSINPSQLRFENQFDGKGHNPSLSSGETFAYQNFIKPSVGVGVSYAWGDDKSANVISNNNYAGKKLNIGFSVFNVSQPYYSFIKSSADKLALRYTGFLMSSFGIENTNMAIIPSVLINMQNKASEVMLGGMVRYTLREQSRYTEKLKGAALSVGGYYRWGDAFSPAMMIESGSLAFGLSYDLNVSGLKTASNGRGGFEFMIRFLNPNPFGYGKSQARFF